MLIRDFLRLTERAWEASSRYLTVQGDDLEFITGAGLGKGLGTDGRRRAPLYLTMKKKHPRKTP